MGQKVNPISNRLGIIRGWDSNWYGGKNYGDELVEDSKIRKYLNVRLAKASVSKIVIERTLKLVTITVCTAKPGIIIGKGGQEVDKLKEELKKITDKEVQINIFEVKKLELDATIVANSIARQVEGMPKNIDKAQSLDRMMSTVGLTKDNCICCGDGFNDMTMIRYAGVGVAMENAQPAIKEAADFVTDSNDNDGIVKVIDTFILPEE